MFTGRNAETAPAVPLHPAAPVRPVGRREASTNRRRGRCRARACRPDAGRTGNTRIARQLSGLDSASVGRSTPAGRSVAPRGRRTRSGPAGIHDGASGECQSRQRAAGLERRPAGLVVRHMGNGPRPRETGPGSERGGAPAPGIYMNTRGTGGVHVAISGSASFPAGTAGSESPATPRRIPSGAAVNRPHP